jgi:hypothetical protein
MVAVVTLRRTSNTAEFIADLVVGNYPGTIRSPSRSEGNRV